MLTHIPDINEDCTCDGRCHICKFSSPGELVICPDCPIHGWTPTARRKRGEILERITMIDKEELTDEQREAMNEKSIQSSIATYSQDEINRLNGNLK